MSPHTLSPGLSLVTPLPTATTVPDMSEPMTFGMWWVSEPRSAGFIDEYATRISTSPSAAPGSCTNVLCKAPSTGTGQEDSNWKSPGE